MSNQIIITNAFSLNMVASGHHVEFLDTIT